MFKALIFDMDGVLVDSMPYHADAWKIVLGEVGIQISRQDIYDIEGSNHRGIIRFMFEKAGRSPPENFEELARKKRDVFAKINRVNIFDGIDALLMILKKKYRLGVVSGSDRAIVMELLTRFFPATFDAVVAGNDVSEGKPSPDPYLKAIEMLRVKKEECLVIENAPLGIEAAKRAGLYCIAIPTYVESHRLKGADIILENHAQLREYLTDLAFQNS